MHSEIRAVRLRPARAGSRNRKSGISYQFLETTNAILGQGHFLRLENQSYALSWFTDADALANGTLSLDAKSASELGGYKAMRGDPHRCFETPVLGADEAKVMLKPFAGSNTGSRGTGRSPSPTSSRVPLLSTLPIVSRRGDDGDWEAGTAAVTAAFLLAVLIQLVLLNVWHSNRWVGSEKDRISQSPRHL